MVSSLSHLSVWNKRNGRVLRRGSTSVEKLLSRVASKCVKQASTEKDFNCMQDYVV